MCPALEDSTCDNDFPTPDYKIPIETRLVKYLRQWLADPNSLTSGGEKIEQEIARLLEWYICECIEYGKGRLGGWWSDGVIQLEIDQSCHNNFKLLGVTYIGCLGIAPFEIDVELTPGIDSHFAKTIFRIGTLDERGQPKILPFDHRSSPSRILEMRPKQNCEWAMAIELTPETN